MSMSEKFKEILAVGGVGLIMLLMKTCAKNADQILKHIDDVTPGVSTLVTNAAPKTARMIARQYIKDDGSESDAKIDTLSDKSVTNYFLLDLAKIDQNKFKTDDTIYVSRIERNFAWLNKFCYYESDQLFELARDTSNKDLQKGTRYFLRLAYSKIILNSNSSFNDSVFYKDGGLFKSTIKPIRMGKEKYQNLKVDQQESLIQLIAKDLTTNYYPYHIKLARKIFEDIVFPNGRFYNKKNYLDTITLPNVKIESTKKTT